MSISISNMKDELKRLCEAPGVSGYEDKVREVIREMISPYGDSTVDNIGNLKLEIPGKGPHIAMVAHMDEIGLVVSNIEKNGYLRVVKVGGVKDSLLPGRHVTIHTENGPVHGVIGHKAPHLKSGDEKEDKIVHWTKTYVDVGASSREEVRDMGIDVPDPITFMSKLKVLNQSMIAGRPLDNRVGCYGLINALKALSDDIDAKLSFVWSVQEEIGLRGARVIANTSKPDYVIALDTYTTSESPGIDAFYKPITLGDGPVLRVMDVRMVSSPKLIKHFKSTAEKKGLPYQYGVTGGTTDGMALQESGCATMSLGVPVRYSHSTVECAHKDDIQGVSDLLVAGVKELVVQHP